MADLEIEIDGKKLKAKPGQTIIQVADESGIYIPRFCYHKNLTAPANCRMCLVEIEKFPKPSPACTSLCADGMKVFTKSQKTIAAQRAVMEFLLINHPLDCPICDQGGECELQDLAMGYGSSHSEFTECKRAVADENLGPLISSDMTRCINCTRCVRFGDEIAGLRELGQLSRGEDVSISTYVQHAIHSEVSGNIIDLCPVGALTSKPYRFTARPWELDQFPGISPHDCVGSHLFVHTRYGCVMRVISREQADLNETWIADRDRYSYTGLYHAERLEEPMIKVNGEWQVVDWQQAFTKAAELLHAVIAEHSSDKIGALASPNSTLEEFYLLQKIIRALGSPHIDHRLREVDTEDQQAFGIYPGFTMPLAELEQCDAILLIGTNIQKELPMVGLRVRKATRKKAVVCALNPIDYTFNFPLHAKKIIAPHLLAHALEDLLQGTETTQAIDNAIKNKEKVAILIGASVMHHPQASLLRSLIQKIAKKYQAKINFITNGANSAGAWLAGAVPHRHTDGSAVNNVGLNAYEMLQKPRKAYLLMNVEPDLDCANAHVATEALKQASGVIALSMYRNPLLDAHAHVILPMAAFTETSGTFINALGTWQSFKGVAKRFGSARPAWKILRVLGNFLDLDGFKYESSAEIKDEIKHLHKNLPTGHDSESWHPDNTFPSKQKTGESGQKISRVGDIPIYAVDSLVRHAKPLQAAQEIMEGELACARIHPETASKLHLQEGDNVRVKQHHAEAVLPLVLDSRVAQDAVWIPGGIAATRELGELFGEVELI